MKYFRNLRLFGIVWLFLVVSNVYSAERAASEANDPTDATKNLLIEREIDQEKMAESSNLVTKIGAQEFFEKEYPKPTATVVQPDGLTKTLEITIRIDLMLEELARCYAYSYSLSELKEMVAAASFNMVLDKNNPTHMKIGNTLRDYNGDLWEMFYMPGMPLGGNYIVIKD